MRRNNNRETDFEVVEVLRVSELPDRAFAEVRTQDGQVRWEEVPVEEARRDRRRLRYYRVIKKRYREAPAPATKPVVRIGASGIIGVGSNLIFKGIGVDGRPEYWHIPSGTVLVEEVGYAARQMKATLLILKKWVERRRGLK